MASPHQLPPQVGDTTNLLLKKLVTSTQALGGSGGIFLTEAEADALYFRLSGSNNPFTATSLTVATVRDGFNLTSAGSIGLTAGGSNKNVTITPSGTGLVQVGTTGIQFGATTPGVIQGSVGSVDIVAAGTNKNVTFAASGTGQVYSTSNFNVYQAADSIDSVLTYTSFVSAVSKRSSITNLALSASLVLNADVGVNSSSAFTDLRIRGTSRLKLGSISQAAWGVTGAAASFGGITITDSSSSGTVATAVANSFAVLTFAASSATTFTDAANLYVAGAPAAGSSVAITRPWAIWVASGNSYFQGTSNYFGTFGGASCVIGASGGQGNLSVKDSTGTNKFNVNIAGGTATASQLFVIDGTAQSLAAYTTTGAQLSVLARTITDTSSSGTVAASVASAHGIPTMAASSATTYTNAANLYIAGDVANGTNVTLTNSYGLWNAGSTKLDGRLVLTPNLQSGAGAVSITTGTTEYTSTGAAQALTLANGRVGQIKTIIHTVDGGSGILTPATPIGYATITFTNVGDSVTMQYTTTGWAVIGSKGAVIV